MTPHSTRGDTLLRGAVDPCGTFESLADDPRPLDWNGPADRFFTLFRDHELQRPIIEQFERVARRQRDRTAVRGAHWLDADQRGWLAAKLQAQAGQPGPVDQLSLRQVLWNKHVLVLSVVLAGSTAVSSGLQLWQPQIIKSYGLTNMQTGLLNAIPFALASVIMIWWGRRSDRTRERIWHASIPLMLTAVSLASALVFTSLISIIIILCLAVIGIYAGKGPVWAVSTEWLSAGTTAAGLAQINAISNLAGFGTTYVMGFIKDATGSFSLALVPLVGLAAIGAWAIVRLGAGQSRVGTTG